MAANGELNLENLKATYKVDDIVLVDSRKLDFANEIRLYYEISFGVGLTLLGVILSEFNWYLFITTIIFLGFGIFNLIRYILKNKELKNSNST